STLFFFFLLLHPPISPLFPYATLFRSTSLYFSITASGFFIGTFMEILVYFPFLDSVVVMTAPRLSKNDAMATIFCLSEGTINLRSEEHTSELQSRENLVCRLLLEKKNK